MLFGAKNRHPARWRFFVCVFRMYMETVNGPTWKVIRIGNTPFGNVANRHCSDFPAI